MGSMAQAMLQGVILVSEIVVNPYGRLRQKYQGNGVASMLQKHGRTVANPCSHSCKKRA